MTTQILDFGAPSPIDVQVMGRDAGRSFAIASALQRRISRLPGAVDVHLRQEINAPSLNLTVDRVKAGQAGLTLRDIAGSMFISLNSSSQLAPNQWLNPRNGVTYPIAVQTPQYRIDTFDALQRTPVTPPNGGSPQLVQNLVTVQRSSVPVVVNHYNVQPVFDIYANVDGRDLGGVAEDVRRIVDSVAGTVPPGTELKLRGQVETMQSSFARLGFGLMFAILLVYLLMVVNFESWLDPLIILMAVPGALAGGLWMLFLTQTTLSVPALMGCIMAIGVATANSILIVVFANEERKTGKSAVEAALSAGFTRFRPVLMTAAAMVLGMIPMALSLGQDSAENAPLARVVIGGLVCATCSTLLFVPVIYTYTRRKQPVQSDRLIQDDHPADNVLPTPA